MFEVIEIDPIVDMHIGIDVRKPPLQRNRIVEGVFDLVGLGAVSHYKSISDLLVFSNILKIEEL